MLWVRKANFISYLLNIVVIYGAYWYMTRVGINIYINDRGEASIFSNNRESLNNDKVASGWRPHAKEQYVVRSHVAHITSNYGERVDPISGKKSFHYGIDIAAPIGTPITSPFDGKVIRAAFDSDGLGNYIEILSPNGATEFYGHMADFSVSEGDSVAYGQLLGHVGVSGRTTGPHVHFAVRYSNGTFYDPMDAFGEVMRINPLLYSEDTQDYDEGKEDKIGASSPKILNIGIGQSDVQDILGPPERSYLSDSDNIVVYEYADHYAYFKQNSNGAWALSQYGQWDK